MSSSPGTGQPPAGRPRRFARLNWQMFGKLLVIVTVMFGFGWALVPIYRTICEITGLNNLTQVDRGAQQFAANTQIDASRKITVEFDANARGPWRFKPEQVSMDVHPGELVTIVYEVQNTLDETVAGQAIPSYAPRHSEGYFRKVECFCFRQQTLGPRESKRFPVVFVVDPKLPSDVGTITLSYTLFKIDGPVGLSEPTSLPTGAMPPVVAAGRPGA